MSVNWSIMANFYFDDILGKQRPPLSPEAVTRLRKKIDLWASVLGKKNQTRTFTEGSASIAVKASPHTVIGVSEPAADE